MNPQGSRGIGVFGYLEIVTHARVGIYTCELRYECRIVGEHKCTGVHIQFFEKQRWLWIWNRAPNTHCAKHRYTAR